MARCAVLLAATVACCLSTGARATELAGTFSGKAVNSFIGMYPGASTSNLDGVGINGTFTFSGSNYAIYSSDPSNYAAMIFGQTKLTFNVLSSSVAGIYAYDSTMFGVQLTSGSSGQGVQIFSQKYPGDDYTDSGLFLAGSGFFDTSNPLSLHPGTVNYAASANPAAFGSRFQFGTGIQLTSVTFSTSVPEPGSIPVLLAGIVTLAGLRTVRRQVRP